MSITKLMRRGTSNSAKGSGKSRMVLVADNITNFRYRMTALEQQQSSGRDSIVYAVLPYCCANDSFEAIL